MLSTKLINSGSTSEYRGGQETTAQTENSKPDRTMSKKKSFSNVVKASAFPKKDQAIIYPTVEGLQMKDYVIATGNIVEPKNILFASRMSNNRICIYLATKQIVENFVETKGGVEINNIFIPARKLIIPAKRIILSNVSPCIPHHIIEEELKELKIKMVSPISFIGAGIGIEGYRHVCSFRRQVYVATDQESEIPSSLLLNYEGEGYRIFLSDDRVICFKCKEHGHIASNCPITEDTDINTISMPEITDSKKRPAPSSNSNQDDISVEVNTSAFDDENAFNQNPTVSIEKLQDKISSKRPDIEILGNVIVTEAQVHYKGDNVSEIKENKNKRRKTEQVLQSEEIYEGIEQYWENRRDLPIDCCNFIQFLKQVRGSTKPIEVARQFSNDVEGIISVLKAVQPLFPQRAIKERCKRLTVSLKKALTSEGKTDISPPESICSETSLSRAPSLESIKSNTSTY